MKKVSKVNYSNFKPKQLLNLAKHLCRSFLKDEVTVVSQSDIYNIVELTFNMTQAGLPLEGLKSWAWEIARDKTKDHFNQKGEILSKKDGHLDV